MYIENIKKERNTLAVLIKTTANMLLFLGGIGSIVLTDYVEGNALYVFFISFLQFFVLYLVLRAISEILNILHDIRKFQYYSFNSLKKITKNDK